MDIYHNPKLADKFTMRPRSAVIVSDGGLLDCEPKQFMPIMDWFVFQFQKYVGIDAYPFVVMKETNLTKLFKNLTNTYSAIVYLDGRTDFDVPKNRLFIRHKTIT